MNAFITTDKKQTLHYLTLKDGVIGAGFSGFLSDKYGRRRSTGRRAKSSTRPRLLRLLAN